MRIASRREAGFVRISVRDNGIGIPLAAQRTIFDKFERVLPRDDGSGEKKVSGPRAWRLRQRGERAGTVQRVYDVAAFSGNY